MFQFFISGWEKLGALVEKILYGIDAGAKESVNVTAGIVQQHIVDAIRAEGAVATGDLMRSVTTSTMQSTVGQYSVQVGSSSPYASFVEDGVHSGGKLPPVENIYEWMIVKGLDPSYSGAFAIAHAIQQRGLPARKPFEKGALAAEQEIGPAVQVVIQRNLDRSTGK
jgi:hypothetical protein